MSSKMFEPCCVNCWKSMGLMDNEELNALNDCSDGKGCVCFDCDPIEADSVPRFFEDISPNELVVIGDVSLELRENELGQGNLFQSRTHERARARGSSSYTYLNRNNKKLGALENLMCSEVCPECQGHSFYVGVYGGESCDTCKDFGSLPVLAKWVRFIVGVEVSNG